MSKVNNAKGNSASKAGAAKPGTSGKSGKNAPVQEADDDDDGWDDEEEEDADSDEGEEGGDEDWDEEGGDEDSDDDDEDSDDDDEDSDDEESGVELDSEQREQLQGLLDAANAIDSKKKPKVHKTALQAIADFLTELLEDEIDAAEAVAKAEALLAEPEDESSGLDDEQREQLQGLLDAANAIDSKKKPKAHKTALDALVSFLEEVLGEEEIDASEAVAKAEELLTDSDEDSSDDDEDDDDEVDDDGGDEAPPVIPVNLISDEYVLVGNELPVEKAVMTSVGFTYTRKGNKWAFPKASLKKVTAEVKKAGAVLEVQSEASGGDSSKARAQALKDVVKAQQGLALAIQRLADLG